MTGIRAGGMTVGTRSVLYGAHQFAIHPWFVAAAWWRLYGLREWADAHRDGAADTWTSSDRHANQAGVWRGGRRSGRRSELAALDAAEGGGVR
jgi:hypothetical protein